jgi:hypothetical protein
MWNTPTAKRLDGIPILYGTEEIKLRDKQIYLHFFLGNCDWYIAEYDGRDLFFGYAILNGDCENAEWGYISFNELKELRIGYVEVDCELEDYWQIKPASQITNIKI